VSIIRDLQGDSNNNLDSIITNTDKQIQDVYQELSAIVASSDSPSFTIYKELNIVNKTDMKRTPSCGWQ
jgi:hypothetical protein